MPAPKAIELHGMKALGDAFKQLPEVAQLEMGDATEATALGIVARARARVRVRYGILRDHIGYKFNPKSGIARVGIEKTTVIVGDQRVIPGRYGHLVEFGHGGPRPAPAYPFMIPAAEAEREAYLQRCRRAGKRIENLMSKLATSLARDRAA